MLRITPCGSAQAAISYFKSGLSLGDYYTKQTEQELIGLWHGKSAEAMTLAGEVTLAEYERLCHNLHPATEERLTARTKDGRRIGYDFNFHVPKSVSAVFELNGDRRILDAFRSAVSETMREIEREMKTRVRKEGEDTTRVTGNMAWAEFVHFTARPVDGLPDPHLHAHCFVFNATYDPVEKQWKAGEFGDLKRDAPYFQAAYHARLAESLRGLGYGITRKPGGWEIEGVPESVVDLFSRRRDQIDRVADELGITDPDKKAGLGATTRDHKQSDLSMEELRAHWRNRLAPEQREALRDVFDSRQRQPALDQQRLLDQALEHAIGHVFENASVIPQRRLLAAALERGVGSVTPEAVRDHLETAIGEGRILRAEYNDQAHLTTPEVLSEEQAMLKLVREGRGQHDPLKPDHAIGNDRLSAEQREAVRHVLESTDSVIAIRGRAGVGKTTTMKEVVAAIEESGTSVRVATPRAFAVHEGLRKDGFGTAQTVARLLVDREMQQDLKGQVLWIDESGLLSMTEMKKLVDLAHRQNARLLLTGDTRQHTSVMRGDAMRLLESETGLKIAELSEIRRQLTTEYREASQALSRGDVAGGFERLDTMGAIREIDTNDREKHLASRAVELAASGNTTLVISPTHAEGRRVSDAIRSELKSRGVIGNDEHAIPRLVNRHLTESERQDPASYRVGDVIEFHQNCPGKIRKSDRAEVVRVQPGDGKDAHVRVTLSRTGVVTKLPLHLANRFAVYDKQTLRLAPGDQIRVTSNGRVADGRSRISNGVIQTFKGIGKDGRLQLGNGKELRSDFGHLAHGYCVTSDAAQSRTVDHVIIAQSSDSAGASNAKQFYTSVTRGRKGVTVFTDDKAKLLRAVSRDTPRITATELMRNAIEPARQRGLTHRRGIGHWLQHRTGRRAKEMFNRRVMQRTLGREQSRSRDRGRERGGYERER
ncbi:MAG: MobF family relaxase [Planctomycetota bacterium]